MMKYSVGQKIYYRGDMANQPGWFTIIKIIQDKWCHGYDMQEIDGDREIKSLYEIGISDVDKGNGATRFVTEEAYQNHRKEQMAQWEATMKRLRIS